MFQEEQNLNQYIATLLAQHPSPLKYSVPKQTQNTLYEPGDNVLLQQNQQKDQRLVARVISIAVTPRWQFPVLLVAWYFGK